MIGYEGNCHLVEDECSKCTMLGANMNFCVAQTEQEFNLTILFPEGSILEKTQELDPSGIIIKKVENSEIPGIQPKYNTEYNWDPDRLV